LKRLVKHHVFIVSAASNNQAVLLLFVFWVGFEEDGGRVNLPLPEGVFFEKNEFLIFDFVYHALEEILFFLFFVPKDQKVMPVFDLNILDVNNNEFLFKRYRIEVFELDVILVNLVKRETLSFNCHQELFAITRTGIWGVESDDKSWGVEVESLLGGLFKASDEPVDCGSVDDWLSGADEELAVDGDLFGLCFWVFWDGDVLGFGWLGALVEFDVSEGIFESLDVG
jgi:hypothetical protein